MKKLADKFNNFTRAIAQKGSFAVILTAVGIASAFVVAGALIGQTLNENSIYGSFCLAAGAIGVLFTTKCAQQIKGPKNEKA